jgi:hypothetical protein
MKPKAIIVNEQDEVIAYMNRAEIQTDDVYRVSALQIKNSA